MGTALTPLQIGSSYSGILKTTDNAALNGVLRTMSDGLGNDSALQVSTANVASLGALTAATAVVASGANPGHAASRALLSLEGSSASYLQAYGANSGTQGTLSIRTYSSDGSAFAIPAVFSSTGLAVAGTLSATGLASTSDTTEATSSTAASMKTAGGLGVAKKAFIGTDLNVAGVSTLTGLVTATVGVTGPHNGTVGAGTPNTAAVTTLVGSDATDASSSVTGAFKTAGGLGVAKKLYVGTDLNVAGNATMSGIMTYSGGMFYLGSAYTATANTTQATIAGLSATVVAGGKYLFRATLFCTQTGNGGYAPTIGGTATATDFHGIVSGYTFGANTVESYNMIYPPSVIPGIWYATNGAQAEDFIITGSIVVNAGGTLAVSFAQNSAANASTVNVGSTFEVFRIA